MQDVIAQTYCQTNTKIMSKVYLFCYLLSINVFLFLSINMELMQNLKTKS